MPGRRHDNAIIDSQLCRRCQTEEPSVTVRTEALCKACFGKYVATKVVKRMESFRVRHAEPGAPRTLLVPLSFGPCSTVLLHVLSQHLRGQIERTGRSGYKLHVLHVRDDTSTEGRWSVDMEKVKRRFPDHSYSVSSFSDAQALEGVEELFSSRVEHDPSSRDDQNSIPPGFSSLLATLPSATARVDVTQILLRKLVIHVAKDLGCEAVLWADSTTRLAERTLAETAKGRGFSLPWVVADGEPLSGVPFYYPMRDLLSKEVAEFASVVDPSLDDIIVKAEVKQAVSTKNTTIDDLMKQFVQSVEKEHPSIVANVVKTTAKLRTVSLDQVETQCELCDMPLAGQAPERSRLCYGCIRTLPQPAGD